MLFILHAWREYLLLGMAIFFFVMSIISEFVLGYLTASILQSIAAAGFAFMAYWCAKVIHKECCSEDD